MRRECPERFPRHRLQRKPLVIDPGMYHGTCVTHVPWRMSGSLTRGNGENVPCIPGASAARNFMYLVRGPCQQRNAWSFCIHSTIRETIKRIWTTRTQNNSYPRQIIPCGRQIYNKQRESCVWFWQIINKTHSMMNLHPVWPPAKPVE